jgi:hypothetical protein
MSTLATLLRSVLFVVMSNALIVMVLNFCVPNVVSNYMQISMLHGTLNTIF